MSNIRRKLKTGLVLLGSCLLLGISSVTIAQTELQVENDGLTLSAFVSSSKDVLSTSIRVVGPDGFVFEDRIEDGALQWIPEGDLADGRYNWEVWTVTVDPGAPMREISVPQAPPAAVQNGQTADQIGKSIERDQTTVEIPIERFFNSGDKRVHTDSGSFEVREGFLVPSVEETTPLSQNRDLNVFERAITAILDFVVPSAHAQNFTDNVTVTKSVPRIIFSDSDAPNSNETTGRIGYFNENMEFSIRYGTGSFAGIPIALYTSPLEIERGARENSLYIRGGGDNPTASQSGRIGLGTSTPLSQLHMSSTRPEIRLQDTDDTSNWYVRNTNDTRFEISANKNYDGGCSGQCRSNPFTIETAQSAADIENQDKALYISRFGAVGVRTDNPNPFFAMTISGFAPNIFFEGDGDGALIGYNNSSDELIMGGALFSPSVQIKGDAPSNSLAINSDGNAGIGTGIPDVPLHVERSGSAGDTDMFRLENDDGSRFQFANTRADGAGGTWEFVNSSSGSNGGAALVIRALHNPGGQEFRLNATGDLTIRGSLSQGSSRAIKSNIVPLSGSAVLANLAKIEFAEWSYDNSPNQRHAGPMAEEFYEVFGLGPDNKHIAPGDMAGVALAATKSLHEENRELKERIAALEQMLLLDKQ